jgi:hypothetical protein
MIRRIVVLILLLTAAACAEQGYAVVVQKANPATKISRALLRRMLMGETAAWPEGEKVVVLLGPAGNPVRGAALKDICGMSESDFTKHALQLSFEGGGKPVPKSLPTDAAVRQVVQITRGGIGIVDPATVDANLKVLVVD